MNRNLLLQPSGLKPASAARPSQGGRGSSLPRLPWPGFEPLRTCLDTLVFDDSYSITGPQGTDPVGNRYREAHHAIASVANWTESKRQRVSILHFDHPVGSSGVVTLSASSIERLGRYLDIPRGGMGTSQLDCALLAAERQARARDVRDVRLTVFSDYQLTDYDTHGIYERLRSFPGIVHAVVLNAVPPVELQVDNIIVTRVSSRDEPGALARTLFKSLTMTRPGAQRS